MAMEYKGLDILQCLVTVRDLEDLCPIINNDIKNIQITHKTLKIESVSDFKIEYNNCK